MDKVYRGAMPSSFRKEKLDDEMDYINSCFCLQILLFSCQYLKISVGRRLEEGMIYVLISQVNCYLLKITRKGTL